jgi:hypothetical protein
MPRRDVSGRNRWMPREGQRYYLILGNGAVQRFEWHSTPFDHEVWNFGNCFRLKRDAERARNTLREILLHFHMEYG